MDDTTVIMRGDSTVLSASTLAPKAQQLVIGHDYVEVEDTISAKTDAAISALTEVINER